MTEEDNNKAKTLFDKGYKTATGEVGTGWMAITEEDIKEILRNNIEEEKPILELFYDYAKEWENTNQFQYETYAYMPDLAVDGIDVYENIDLRENWFHGYVEAMLEIHAKSTNKAVNNTKEV